MSRIDRIKAHFEEEAKTFDTVIRKIIPRYNEMVDVLISVIPFARDSRFSVIDLGCGTGTISAAVKSGFPNVDITCVDIAADMLEMAKAKIGGDVHCIQADLNTFEFPKQYAAVVSSLALHHLETDADKLAFYKKIHSALISGGIFVNIDFVLAGDDTLQNLYMNKWKSFMLQNVSEEEVTNKWLPSHYAEDRPAKLLAHIDMLKECAFSCVDVVCKYYSYAVYMARK